MKTLNEINEYLKRQSLFGYLMHNTFKTLIFIFTACFGFLFIFKPYFLVNYNIKPFLILITGYSFIASLSYALSFAIFSPHDKTVWTKRLEIGLFALAYFIAWLLIWGYTIINIEFFFIEVYQIALVPPLPENVGATLLFYTVVIGLLLYLVIHSYDILITHEKLGHREKEVDNTEVRMNRLGCKKTKKIKLVGKNDNELLEIEYSQFIAAEVNTNYINITYQCCNNAVKQYRLRNSMHDLEIQLGDSDRWFRCYKSYIINLDHLNDAYTVPFKKTSFVTLNHYPNPIPVSPRKISFLKSILSKNDEGFVEGS